MAVERPVSEDPARFRHQLQTLILAVGLDLGAAHATGRRAA